MLKGREKGLLAEVAATETSPYVRRSLYWRSLEPFVAGTPPDQLLVIRTEDLDSGETWLQILDFLGLPDSPAPSLRYNESSAKAAFRRPLPRALSRPVGRLRTDRVPGPVRALGRVALTRDPNPLLMSSGREDPVPATMGALMREDAQMLHECMGVDVRGWPTMQT